VSNLNKKIYAKIEAWRNAPIEGDHPYIYLDGIVMVRRISDRTAITRRTSLAGQAFCAIWSTVACPASSSLSQMPAGA
jgi:hypothetical protein